MVEKKPDEKKPENGAKAGKGAGAEGAQDPQGAGDAAGATKKAKKEKPIADPSKRGYGGFDRSLFKGKNPIFRTMKKSGR